MRRSMVAAIGVGGAVLLGGAGWLAAQRVYLGPKRELERQIAQNTQYAGQYEALLSGERQVRDDLAAFARQTLGRTPDAVEHRFRAGLSEVARRAGLREAVVGTTPGRAVASPVEQARGLDRVYRNIFKDQRDFMVVPGRVTGRGTLEACLATLASLEAQAWVHRIDGFSLEPRRDRKTFDLSVAVATVYMPDLSPQGEGTPEVAPTPETLQAVYRPIALKNVFAAPPAPTPASSPTTPPSPPQPVATTPPPASPGYEQWRVAGITESPRQGVVVWVTHVGNGSVRALEPGKRVLQAELVGVEGGAAVVRIDGQEFLVEVGQTLAERTPRAG